jgi:hypothetical protein
MAYSFIGYNIALVVTFLLLAAATALLFIAPTYLTVTNSATTNATIVANNKTAQGALYGAAVSALIAVLILFVFFFFYFRFTVVDVVTLNTPVLVEGAKFGWGYYIALLFAWILTIVIVGLGIYGISYIDTSTNNTGGSTARSLAIIGVVLGILSFFLILYMVYETWAYNRYLDTLLVEPVVGVAADARIGPISLVTNPGNNNNTFTGEVRITGTKIKGPTFTMVNGVKQPVSDNTTENVSEVIHFKDGQVDNTPSVVQKAVVVPRERRIPVVANPQEAVVVNQPAARVGRPRPLLQPEVM